MKIYACLRICIPFQEKPFVQLTFIFCLSPQGKNSPPKKTTTSLQQVFPSKIVENKTIAIPNSPYTFWIVGSLVSRQTKSRDQSKRATANVCTLDSKLNASFYKHKSI